MVDRIVNAFTAQKHPFEVYPEQENSHVSGEYDTLTEALRRHRATPEAEIIQNGTTMAEADGRRWKVTYQGEQVLKAEKAE